MRTAPFAALVLALALRPLMAQPDIDGLRARLAARIAGTPEGVVGIAFHELRGGGALLEINRDSVFHAASTMKIPVMIEYFRDVDAGRITPDQPVLLLNAFASIVDHSLYALDAGDDSDSSMYRLVGERVPVSRLVEHMITRSSNLATNTVIELVSAGAADTTAHALGATHIRVLRGVEDGKAFRAGLSNTTTPADLGVLLEAIEQRRAASPASCNAMLAILERQEFNDEIPAGLPPGTRVAHKTGWITGVLHDAAIVYPSDRPPYVLVVLTRGIPEESVARRLIVDLSREVWAWEHRGGS